MIDVIKRLAELDAKNPNVVKESQVEECGMGMMPMEKPHSPATLNITADSGEELGDMLSSIMKLAGMHQVGSDDLGHEPEPAVVTAEPSISVAHDDEPSVMRSMMDKLNPADDEGDEEGEGDEETDESWDNTPADPAHAPSMKQDALSNVGMHNQDQSGHPGVGDRIDGKQPKAFATMEDKLMADYREFIGESEEQAVAEGANTEVADFIDNEMEMGAAYSQAVIAACDEFNMEPRDVDQMYRSSSLDADAIPPINFGDDDEMGMSEMTDLKKLAGLK